MIQRPVRPAPAPNPASPEIVESIVRMLWTMHRQSLLPAELTGAILVRLTETLQQAARP